jgi:hypothetical protein
MINSFPITVISTAPTEASSQQAGSNSGGDVEGGQGIGGGSATRGQQPPFPGNVAPVGAGMPQLVYTSADQPDVSFLDHIYAAVLLRLGEFGDAQALADAVRPLARMRGLPPRTLLEDLGRRVQTSGQLSANQADVSAAQALRPTHKRRPSPTSHHSGATRTPSRTSPGLMSDHAVCLALFLFQMMGHEPEEGVWLVSDLCLSVGTSRTNALSYTPRKS